MNLYRVERETFRWTMATLASVGLHGAVAAAILLDMLLSPRPPALPPSADMVIEVSLVPAAPPVPPRQVPPGPEQEETRPTPPRPRDPLRLPPIPASALAVRPAVVVPARRDVPDEKPPEEVRRVEVSTAPTASAAPPAPVASAPAIGAPANSVNAQQTWDALVVAAFQRAKRYPTAARRNGLQGTAQVRIIVDPNGTIRQASLRRSSGHAELDAEAVAAARRIGRLPPPPDGVSTDIFVPVLFYVPRGRER